MRPRTEHIYSESDLIGLYLTCAGGYLVSETSSPVRVIKKTKICAHP